MKNIAKRFTNLLSIIGFLMLVGGALARAGDGYFSEVVIGLLVIGAATIVGVAILTYLLAGKVTFFFKFN
ncbi:MAG: hypothetical protein OCD00_15530 [Colwellia sp.]